MSIELISDANINAAHSSCRRRVFCTDDLTAIVFTSDAESYGRSLTNIFEDFAQATVDELKLDPTQVRWFEHRTDEETGSGYKQTPKFEEVKFKSGALQEPQWHPSDSFGASLRALIEK